MRNATTHFKLVTKDWVVIALSTCVLVVSLLDGLFPASRDALLNADQSNPCIKASINALLSSDLFVSNRDLERIKERCTHELVIKEQRAALDSLLNDAENRK
jgi:hypothetical protein